MKHRSALVVAMLAVLVSLACGLTERKGDESKEEPTPVPAATQAPPTEAAPTEAAPIERVQLDPCQLLTEAEVSELLGGSALMQPSVGTGGCVYALQSDDPSAMVQFTLSAAQGNEAKAFTVLGLGLLAGFSGDPTLMADFEALNDQLPDLSLAEVVNRMAEIFQGTPLEVVQADGPGESALWLAYSDEFYSQGTLVVVRGDEYVSLTLIGGDLESAPDRLASLAGVIFDRLPPAFYVLDEDGDGDFSFEFSAEVDLGEDEEAEPTPEVVSGLVWVTASNPGQVFAIDPMTNQVIASVEVGQFPSDIAVAEGNVWVVSETEGAVRRIDAKTFELVDTVSLGGNTLQVAAGGGSVWVTGGLGLRKIDLATGTRYDVVYNRTYDVAIGENAIWVSQSQDQQLLKIDPTSRDVIATVKLEGQPGEMAYGHGVVWVILNDKNELVGIDPDTLEIVTTVTSDWIIHDVAIGPARIWCSGPVTIHYIDSTLLGSGSFSVPSPPYQLTYYAGSLWATSPNEGVVMRIDPQTLDVIADIDLGAEPKAIAAGE